MFGNRKENTQKEGFQRKPVTDYLFNFDTLHMKEFSKEKLAAEEYKSINEAVLWMESELKLNDFSKRAHQEPNNRFKSGPGVEIRNTVFTERQYFCYSQSLVLLNNGRIGQAYHEMCDFILNYKRTLEEPISDFEIALLSVWVEVYKDAYKKLIQ